MIYSITLNLEQYEPREVLLIELSIFSWPEAAKRRRIKLEDVMDIDNGKNLPLIVRGFLTNATSVNI